MKRLNLDWFKETRTGVSIFCVLVYCVGFGMGMWLMHDSDEAQITRLKQEKKILESDLIMTVVTIDMLDLQIETMVRVWKKFLDSQEEERTRDWNDTAIDDS